MSPQNLTNVYNQNPTLQGQYTLQQYLDLFSGSSTGTTTPTTNTTTTTPTTNASQGIINSGINQYQGGGDGNRGGGGAFGNLDISDVKTFQKDVYNAKKGIFEQQTVTGYKNPSMGNYQTFDGKNINHAGIKAKPIIGLAIEAMGFGPKKDEKGYYDKQISGLFTGYKPGDFKDFRGFIKTKKDRQKFMDDNKKTIDRIEKERIVKELDRMQRERDLKTIQYRTARGDSMSDIGRDMYTGPGKAFAPRKDTFTGGKTVKSSSTPGGYYSSPKKDGGLMGRGGSRRKSYFDGGIVSLRRR